MGAAVALVFSAALILVTVAGIGLALLYRRRAIAARRAAAPLSAYEQAYRRFAKSGLPEDRAAMEEALENEGTDEEE